MIGDVMVDRYIQGTIERISPEAPVPVVKHAANISTPGGAANVAANIASLGGDVTLVGLVGDDLDSRELRELVSGIGISSVRLLVDESRPTTSKTRVVSGRHQLLRIDQEQCVPPPASVAASLLDTVSQVVDGADIVVLSDYAKGCLVGTLATKVIDLAKAAGCFVIVDPKRCPFDDYRGADLIKPNRKELSTATGRDCRTDQEVESAASLICSGLQTTVLVTRDEAGMSLVQPDRPAFHVPAEIQEVADVSGAGDTALAALAVALAEGKGLHESMAMANAAASLAVTKAGTSIVSRSELERKIARAATLKLHPGALVSAQEAARIAALWRQAGEKIVFTNGCFDLVHSGHIRILSAAAAQGNRLIVGLNSDASVRRLKGPTRPIQSEVDRARIIGSLRMIDLIVIFDDDTPLEVICEISPDVLVKGADYKESEVVGGTFVKSRGGRVALIPLVEGQSSTRLIEKARI